jgi:hypothetical protein
MKKTIRDIRGKKVIVQMAAHPGCGEWCYTSCAVCGIAVLCRVGDAMQNAQAHAICYKSASGVAA